MKKKRRIIEIDEEKCTGCGQCIIACAEGALELVDGKARLVGEVFCDGLGACIGDCPEGALQIIEREADEFDEKAVEEKLDTDGRGKTIRDGQDRAKGEAPFQCPHTAAVAFDREETARADDFSGPAQSHLGHWPIKLALLGPGAPFLEGADLLLLADCAAAAFPDLHRELLRGRVAAMACPKLDDIHAHIERLAAILKGARLKRLTVVHMEVPCCHGMQFAAEKALALAGVTVPLRRIVVSRHGEIISEGAVRS